MEIKLNLPLFVWQRRKTKPDKKIYLNKNIERNLHFQIYRKLKQEYKEDVREALYMINEGMNPIHPIMHPPFRCTYTLFPATKRKVDIVNPLSIVCKFAEDALTELGFWEDDNMEYVPEVNMRWGNVDKDNPRCELTIKEI